MKAIVVRPSSLDKLSNIILSKLGSNYLENYGLQIIATSNPTLKEDNLAIVEFSSEENIEEELKNIDFSKVIPFAKEIKPCDLEFEIPPMLGVSVDVEDLVKEYSKQNKQQLKYRSRQLSKMSKVSLKFKKR